MRKNLLPCLLLIANSIFAQSPISYLISDVYSSGQTQRLAVDTNPNPNINFGSKGTNQVYDFSNFTSLIFDTIEYRVPTSGQLSTAPNADVASTLDGTNFLLTNTDNANNKLILEGFEGQITPGNTIGAAYSTKPELVRFPTTYQTNFSGNGYLQKTVPGSQVGQPTISQIRLTITSTYTDTIDGWGKVITPLGAYKCLRKQRKETTTTLIEAQVFPPFWTQVSNTTSTTTRYSYITKESKGSVINFNFDSANVVQSVSWSLNPPTAPVADFSWVNPSGGLVSFTDLSANYPDAWSWNFGDGSSASTMQNPNHTYAANTTYNVCLTATNPGGSNQVCKNVVVTGVTAANSAPVAADDTFSVLQATSIIKVLTGNDLDPDGDSLCITAVWGTPSVQLNAGAPCTDILYLSDTCFVGNQVLYYAICDNGSPSLCDTGMVTVTVIKNDSYFSTAYFDLSLLQHDCAAMSITNGSSNALSSIWLVDDFFSADSNSYSTTDLSNATFDNSDFNGQICLTTTGMCNTDLFCDTTTILCSGIDENYENGFLLYPNPVNHTLRLGLKGKENVRLNIINIMGQVMSEITIGPYDAREINVSELPEGNYFVLATKSDGDLIKLGRFVISR